MTSIFLFQYFPAVVGLFFEFLNLLSSVAEGVLNQNIHVNACKYNNSIS